MPININDDFTGLETAGQVIADARQQADGWREVSHRPRFFNRDQAITALTITGLLASGRDSSDPAVNALCQVLR